MAIHNARRMRQMLALPAPPSYNYAIATTDPTATTPAVTLRPAEPADTDECARICFEAFAAIHDHHRFPRDFPVPEAAQALMEAWIPHPKVWGVVAEADGRIVGSNFLDERDPIAGVGPITVDPGGQNSGVGRRLMEGVLERGKDARGVRLLQDGFHMRSLSLYQSLGFDVKASCIVMSGKPRGRPVDGVEVRPLGEDDLEECGALCKQVHGFERTGALRDSVLHMPNTPFAALRDGRIVAYASAVDFWPMAHGVAESDEDLQALLLAAAGAVDGQIALLVPLESDLFRWGLEQGLPAVKPMNLMARGEHQEPRGAWFPSVIY
jgi:predicted N-acetyltransferase YhbS